MSLHASLLVHLVVDLNLKGHSAVEERAASMESVYDFKVKS